MLRRDLLKATILFPFVGFLPIKKKPDPCEAKTYRSFINNVYRYVDHTIDIEPPENIFPHETCIKIQYIHTETYAKIEEEWYVYNISDELLHQLTMNFCETFFNGKYTGIESRAFASHTIEFGKYKFRLAAITYGTQLRDKAYGSHIQHINVSMDLSREDILELGRKGPYFRFVD